MDNVSLVRTALEYYDSNTENYSKYFKNIIYGKFVQAESDIDHNMMIFYDKNKNEIFRSEYEIIGVYNSNTNTWTWAWAIPSFKKNNTNIIRKVWNYGAILDPKERYLKTELITSRFRVADGIQLDIHSSIASYLSKSPVVYKYKLYIKQQPDIEGFLQLNTHDDNDDFNIYYMFLLNHKNITENKNDDEKCSDD